MAETEKQKAKRERSVNFSDVEISTLIDEVEKNFRMLVSRIHGASFTQKKKNEKWEEIAGNVAARSNSGTRTGEQVRKKWQEMRSRTGKWITSKKNPKTGGGPPEKEHWWYDTVLRVVGEESPIFYGITGE